MLTHFFLTHTTKHLIDLRGNFMATLNNPVCQPIHEPVSNTIAQINQELALRGLTQLKTQTPATA